MQHSFRRLLVSLVTLAMVIGLISPASAATVTVSGYVKNEQQAPVPGTAVAAVDPASQAVVVATTTDANGQYSLAVAPGTYDFRATPPAATSYLPATVQGKAITGDTLLNLTLVLPRSTVTVTGKVTNGLGAGLPGQNVKIQGPNGTAEAVTDAAGDYTADVPPGEYTIEVSAETNDSAALHAAPTYIAKGAGIQLWDSQTVNVSLPFKQVSISVRKTDDSPVAGASISAPYEWNAPLPASVFGGLANSTIGWSEYLADAQHAQLTDAAGNATLWLFPMDIQYDIRVTSPVGEGGQKVQVKGDMAVPITIDNSVTISGKITNALGEGLSGQKVQFSGQNGTRERITDADGNYSLSLPPGRYNLAIQPEGGTNPVTMHAPTWYHFLADDYTFAASRTLDIRLPIHRIDMRVVNEAGQPISGARLSNFTWMGGSYPQAPSADYGAAGRVQIYSTYSLQPLTDADGRGTIWLSDRFDLDPYIIGAQVSEARGGSFQTMASTDVSETIVVKTPVTVTGTLRNAEGTVLPDQMVRLFGPTGSSGAYTDSQGRYTVQVSPGDYGVGIQNTGNTPVAAPSRYSVAAAYATFSAARTFDVTLPLHRIDVRVQDLRGNPVAGVALTTNSVPTNLPPEAFGMSLYANQVQQLYPADKAALTDANGEAVLWLFPHINGTYTVTAMPPAELPFQPLSLTTTGQADQDQVIQLQFSHPAPVTTATVTGEQNADGLYVGEVQVSLTAAAATGYVLEGTYYQLDGGPAVRYAGVIKLTAPGAHHIAYWSQDTKGVFEQTRELSLEIAGAPADTTPPVTVADAPLPTEWVREAVITFTATDDLSGVKATHYTVTEIGTGANIGSATGTTLEIPVSGEYRIGYWSEDNAGNVEQAKSLTVKVDKMGPVMNAHGELVGDQVMVTLSGSDAHSGMDRIEYSLDGGATWVLYTGAFPLPDGFSGKFLYRGFDKVGNMTLCEVWVSGGFDLEPGVPGPYRICGKDLPGATVTIKVIDPATGREYVITVVADANGDWCGTVEIPDPCTCKLIVTGPGGVPCPPKELIIGGGGGTPSITPEIPEDGCGGCGWYPGPVTIVLTPGGGGGGRLEINTGGGWGPYPGDGGFTVSGDGHHNVGWQLLGPDGSVLAGGGTEFGIDTEPPSVGWGYDPDTDTVTGDASDTGSGLSDDGLTWGKEWDSHCGCWIIIPVCRDRVGNTCCTKVSKPELDQMADQEGYEGDEKSWDLGAFHDLTTAGPWTVSVNWGDGSADETFTTSSLTLGGHVHAYGDNGVYDVRVVVLNAEGLGGVKSFKATVHNVDPEITNVTGPVAPVRLGTPIDLTATFTDPGWLDTHTSTIDWGDGNSDEIAVDEVRGAGSLSGNHLYAGPGVYTVTITVVDDDLGDDVEIYQFIVIYDPDGGFVTGGGWIQSPAGAYKSKPGAVGRANFGFNAKYKQGATVPEGQTEFQFKAGDLNFHSTDYEWLVVAGNKAQYKGTGTINGDGDYGFMLTMIDGQVSGGTDKFRIKIWDRATETVIYDNQMGAAETADPTTALAGGQVMIHKEK